MEQLSSSSVNSLQSCHSNTQHTLCPHHLDPVAQEEPSELRSQHAEFLTLVQQIQKYLLVRGFTKRDPKPNSEAGSPLVMEGL